MQNGNGTWKFPYAHLDILIADDGTYYLSEIALNGGTKGSMIRRDELDRKKQDVLERLANIKGGIFESGEKGV